MYKVGKVATKEWTKAKSADTGFVFVLAAKTIQALNVIKPGSDMYFIHFTSKMLFAMGND